jgi:opacity protein-like surface antigen
MQKHMSLTTIIAVFSLLLIGLQSPTNADGLYFGGGGYLSRAEIQTLDETDETLAFQLGYNLIDSSFLLFSIELGSYDLGNYSEDGIEVDADAIGVAAVGGLPLGPFIELYGKAGIAEVNVEVNDNKFDGTETFYGAGVSFDILDTIDFYLEYIEFDTEVDSSLIGVGVRLDLF